MLRYPVLIEPDGDGFMASFRDIPEALTGDDTIEATRAMAADALLTAMDFYFDDKRPVPPPSAARKGEELIALPASVSAKILLLNEMVSQKIGSSELARRLGTSPQVITRVLDLSHTTKIDAIADALKALGKELEISVA
ncbi:type II toxin-antitoxin system HicB family antitoxin [Robbsia andropogonis]|uniref:type II toxin-antitoxin system HicB family antitoxin n=1 Tax=Robbsia andropogonis TaxID=28092 RepID=UPI0004671E20|nr:type II toxin-antitoxin system HicB family antitoxin [Robbsia andropogonis]